MKILIVEDEVLIREGMSDYLMECGYEVFEAGDGQEALDLFHREAPDLVLLDINMPGLNGFEVAEKIREQDRHVLIFFLSDRSDKNDRLKGFSLRGNDYLAKPFYPEELIARIKDRFEIGVHENVQEESFHFGNTTFNYTTNEIRTGNNKVLITSRQADLLRILATNLNLAVDRDLLLETVWGTSSYANSLALNVQVTYLRKALHNDPSTGIVLQLRPSHEKDASSPNWKVISCVSGVCQSS